MLTPVWSELPPTAPVVLLSNDVHVWKIDLNRAPSEIEILSRTLSPVELKRAERFHFDRDCKHFIVAHGQLRKILGRYLDMPPVSLDFGYGPRGKPFILRENARGLNFNLSHSGSIALLGVTLTQRIGIDAEQIRHLDDAGQIAAQFFSPFENEALVALPKEERLTAFFDCWTLKEAYIKATGDGLACPTKSFDVVFHPASAARLVTVEGEPSAASRWSLLHLIPEAGYVGAIAVEGHDWTPQFMR